MSLGKDLARIRKGLGLTLEEIQGIIKIPVHTLKSIESDHIFDDETQNKTYTRSFVRSYAKALKIDDTIICNALDEVEAGMYTPGSLVEKLDSDAPKLIFKPDVLVEEDEEDEEEEDSSSTNLKKPDIETAEPIVPPTLENVNWADMGKRFSKEERNPIIWKSIFIIVGIIIIASIIFIFRTQIAGWFDTPEIEITTAQEPTLNTPLIIPPADSTEEIQNTPEATPDPLETPSTNQTPPAVASANPFSAYYSSTLGDTLTITVYAAYDKLEPVRVTSDFNWRTNPFWMEQGQAYNFSFRDTILVRGQYSRMLLLFNGHVIENPRSRFFREDFDSIMLTRQILSTPTFLAPPPQEFPLEIGVPDSIVYPLSY